VRNGLLNAAVSEVDYLVPGGWGSFMSFRPVAAASGAWADSVVSVPVWLLCAAAVFILATLGAVAFVASVRRRKRDAEIAPLTEAEIFGIRWRWNNHEGDIRDITSYCPECDLEVRPTKETRHNFLNLISYQCACGKWRSKSFQCSDVDMIDRVYRTIRKQVRT